MPYIGRNPDKGNFSDLNGAKLIIDAEEDIHGIQFDIHYNASQLILTKDAIINKIIPRK